MVEVTPKLAVRPLTIEDGMDIAMWRYPGPWAVYDALEAPRPDEGYWAICDEGDRLVGFCCLGDCARPVGLAGESGVLDVAIGVRPELTGQGLGAQVGKVAVDYARQVSDGRRPRCAVRDWNTAGLEAARHAGFTEAGEHTVEGQRYILLDIPATGVERTDTDLNHK